MFSTTGRTKSRKVSGNAAWAMLRPKSDHVLAAGRRHSLGLREDGTVVAAGMGSACECRTNGWGDVSA